MKRLAIFLTVCTVAQAISQIRPGSQWYMNDAEGLVWLDTSTVEPSQSEIQSGIASCQSAKAALAAQIQSDISTLNVSTNTAVQKLPALVDLLKQRGLLQ